MHCRQRGDNILSSGQGAPNPDRFEGVTIFSHFRHRLTAERAAPTSIAIEALTPVSTANVRLPITSRFSNRTLADHTRAHPGMGLIANSGRDYLIAGSWRHRSDIVELIELSSGDHRGELIRRLASKLAGAGVKLLILDYSVGAHDPSFFRREGFVLIERILEFERLPGEIGSKPRPVGFTMQNYTAAAGPRILDLEKQAFPWLWWNSNEEWSAYIANPGVEIIAGYYDGEIVGYAGFVVYRNDGHLDRLAVHRNFHGRGLGSALLTEAMIRMADRGAKRIALTTQENNYQAQRLYENYGFRRGRWTYEIHGKWLGPGEDPRT